MRLIQNRAIYTSNAKKKEKKTRRVFQNIFFIFFIFLFYFLIQNMLVFRNCQLLYRIFDFNFSIEHLEYEKYGILDYYPSRVILLSTCIINKMYVDVSCLRFLIENFRGQVWFVIFYFIFLFFYFFIFYIFFSQ